MNNHRLLQATTIIERHFTRRVLKRENSSGEAVYCALGAIGKAYQDGGDINSIDYFTIPMEDVIVLAAEIDETLLDETIDSLKTNTKVESLGGVALPGNLQGIVTAYNDRHNKEEVVEKFKAACKNYNKHLPKIAEARRAIKIWEERHRTASCVSFLSDKKGKQDDKTKSSKTT